MTALRERRQEVVGELSVLEGREAAVEQSGKDSGLCMVGQYQVLLVEANLAAKEEEKERQLLESLRQRREGLQREVQLLAGRQKQQRELQQRWRSSRTCRLSTAPSHGMPLHQLEAILRVLFLLLKLAEQPQGQPFDCAAHEQALPNCQQFASKREVVAYYANLGVTADNMDVNAAVDSYRRQEGELDRWERASRQASCSLQSLQETYDQLSAELERLHAKKDKHAMHTLKMREASIRDQELAFSKSCAFLTAGLSRLGSLVRKL